MTSVLVRTLLPLVTSMSSTELTTTRLLAPPLALRQATPTSLTLVASASGGNTYPIATLPGTATQLVWSPNDIDQAGPIPLAAATYTMSIWDERGPKATPAGGRMSVNVGIVFALYRPQKYVGLDCEYTRSGGWRERGERVPAQGLTLSAFLFASAWTCATCSAGSSVAAYPGVLLALMTTIAMLISGWSLLRRGRPTNNL